MMHLRIALLAALVCATPVAWAGDRAHDWLMRINDAARRLDYDGTFVYLHGGMLEALRIVHRNDGGRVRERLLSLNGAPREVLRDGETVQCYLPDEKSVVVEQHKADARGFPALLPEQLAVLDENYAISLGPTMRVAGRRAQQIIVRPHDKMRYGHHLWADVETGLLLKADLLDTNGEMIEQFMFSQIMIGDVPMDALKAENSGAGLRWHRVAEDGDSAAVPGAWTLTVLPKGFRLATRMTRKVPVRNVPVEHLVVSDGLATVSVFIEKAGASPAIQGTTRMGAVHAHGRRMDGHQVTAVGEAPQATVVEIANAVAPRR